MLDLVARIQVYLVEEDQASRRARKKSGGNSGKRFTEGWVEFEDKKVARGKCLNRPWYHELFRNKKHLIGGTYSRVQEHIYWSGKGDNPYQSNVLR